LKLVFFNGGGTVFGILLRPKAGDILIFFSTFDE